MILDLEPFRKSVIRKLEEQNFNFNENDIILLDMDDELRYRFYDTLKRNPSLFTKDLLEIIEDFSDYQEVLMEDLNLLMGYCKALIDKGDYSGVLGIREYVDEEKSNEILEYFFKAIDVSPNPDKLTYIDSELIEIAIDYKKEQFLRCIKSCGQLDESTITKLKAYVSTVDIVPDFLFDNYSNMGLDYSRYSATALLKIFNKEATNNIEFLNSEDAKKIYDLIIKKLKDKESIDLKEFNNSISETFLDFDNKNKRNLIEMLVNIVGLNSSIVYSMYSEFAEYEELLVSSITRGTNLRSMAFYDGPFNKSQRILDKLIEFGHIDYATKFDNFDKYIPMIIEKIKSGDPLFKDMKFKDSSYFNSYPELLQVLVEYGMVSTLSFANFQLQGDDKLLQFVLEEIRKGTKLELKNGCFSINGIFKTVIQSRNFDTLQNSELSQIENITLTEEEINILIEEFKTNIKLADILLSKASDFIFKNKGLLNFYLQSNGYFIEKVIDKINHHENLEHFYNEEIYTLVKDYYALKYSLNIEHLDAISTKFGMKVIRYLDNEVIHQLINLSDEEFNKFIELFPNEKMNLNDIINIYDSIMQYKFSKEHPEVVNIFADIMHSLDDRDNIYVKKLEELYSILNDKFYDKFKEQYPQLVEIFKNDPKQFLLQMATKIQNREENSEQYIEILHFITNYYIAYKREKYRETYDIYRDSYIHIPYDLDEKDLEKKLVEYCLNNYTHAQVIMSKLVEQGLSYELAKKCRLYFLSKKDKTSKDSDKEIRILDGSRIEFSLYEVEQIRKNLRIFNMISKEYVKNTELDYVVQYLDGSGIVERNYKAPENSQDVYQLLISLNVNSLKSTLEHSEAYESLLQTMRKYRLHFIPAAFKELLESKHIEISGDYSNLSGFISYYDKIYETEKSRLESQGKSIDNIMLKPVGIFIYGEVYSSASSVYSQVLTTKDAKLIKANPKENQATRKTKGNERLNEAVEWTIRNFRRMKVTIPTFAQNIPLESGKMMHVVVGNFTNPSNVTHGERTGACMRIGGLGETLFQFCLANENGFHIRFENPETGEYISRVSGFRNGNTVFLNELRNSCNSADYSNDDVVEACRRMAELLIDKSKDSTCPIENVVVHQAYAVDSDKYPKTHLGVVNIKTGLPHFYSDVSTSAHVLATSSTTDAFVPLDFDKSQVPVYLPAREKAKESTNLKDMIDIINRVSGVKALLEGQPLESLEPVIVDESFIYGIASNDWYIYIDSNLVVHEDIIHIDERAKEELAVARKRVEEMLPVIEKEQAYSY